MTETSKDTCPLCHRKLKRNAVTQGWTTFFSCNHCGDFGLDDIIIDDGLLDDIGRITSRYLLTHPDSNFQQDPDKTPIITSSHIEKYKEQHIEPTALEVLDNLLSYYCNVGHIGQKLQGGFLELTIASKSLNFETGFWAIEQANAMGWFDQYRSTRVKRAGLCVTFIISAKGWQNYYEIQKNKSQSKQAFLALQFNNQVLRNKIIPEIKSACEQAGFNLLAVNEKRQAGLIDNKIRVDIRNSRFLVVDISDQNQGAYFEAGFAEGLGKPVFYICDKTVFDKHHQTEKRKKTVHFDVEHHDIIVWEENNPKAVADQLLASIRNTLPDEAKMSG